MKELNKQNPANALPYMPNGHTRLQATFGRLVFHGTGHWAVALAVSGLDFVVVGGIWLQFANRSGELVAKNAFYRPVAIVERTIGGVKQQVSWNGRIVLRMFSLEIFHKKRSLISQYMGYTMNINTLS